MKRDENGNEAAYKARFHVKGCCDKSKAFKDTFAPTLRYATLRVIMALSARMGATIHQMDVKAAFVHAKLLRPVYIEQPKFHEVGDPKRKVLKLLKALYGLVEAPRLWYETFATVLLKIGFKRVHGDPCLFAMIEPIDGQMHSSLLGVFVDDILMFGTKAARLDEIKVMIGKNFVTKDLGPAKWALGMRVQQGGDHITLDQTRYLTMVLSWFKEYIEAAKAVHYGRAPITPLVPGATVARRPPGGEPIKGKYREAVGCLAYLSIGTGPDITHAVSVLSRHLTHPGKQHWDMVMHTMRYLEATVDIAIKFKKRPSPVHHFEPGLLNNDGHESSSIVAASDSDWATDPDSSKSISGMMMTLTGAAISWHSKM